MMIFERIQELAKRRDKSLQDIAVDLEFSKNLFYRWKTSEPKARDLQKVADYFNVSVDYLLGREEQKTLTENDLTAFFRINTEGMSENEIDILKEELEDFMFIRAERLKRRNKEKKDD